MASGQAAEAVTMLEMRNDGRPGQHQQNPMVQYSTLEVTTERPRDHIIWSLCCFVYGNPFCLGLAALIFSIKASDRKVVGDIEGARHYSSTACSLNIAATVLVFII
ncbi:dispanin subfamily A member 2b-like [Girardinichthys multiradiatus]|uniref:dispanin subfamily A member 2b-like n=1 Tax=Girardinichthys multiradiatus TaxID=208333 RepID=UPI001FACEEBB|nr:dispanin subfamily A member 2b-like [Girardinichthys multiradiatus]